MAKNDDLERLLLRVGETDVSALKQEGYDDVVFGLRGTDYFFADLATRIVMGGTITAEERSWLERSLIVNDSIYAWTDDYGREVDLSSAPELLAHIRLLEELARAALARLDARASSRDSGTPQPGAR